jgi:hypothetical protein
LAGRLPESEVISLLSYFEETGGFYNRKAIKDIPGLFFLELLSGLCVLIYIGPRFRERYLRIILGGHKRDRPKNMVLEPK